MNTYKVGIFEETGGYVYIKAKNKKDARFKVEEGLEEDGINYFNSEPEEGTYKLDITHFKTEIIEEPKISK
jgi:hypothetical protein